MPGALLQRRDASPRGSRFPARPGAATQFCCSHARSRQFFRIDRQRAPLAFSNLMMITSRLAVVGLLALVAACAGDPPVDEPPLTDVLAQAQATPTLGPDSQFSPSPYEDVGLTGLFPVHMPEDCNIAVLDSGEDSFAVRMQSLRNASRSIRIQALVFKGDEAGLRIAEVLKQKRAEGLDVRVIVDAFSNPWLQAQWMLFDLKQNGVEVEGYEALALQWINEVAVPLLTPHYNSSGLDNRYHEILIANAYYVPTPSVSRQMNLRTARAQCTPSLLSWTAGAAWSVPTLSIRAAKSSTAKQPSCLSRRNWRDD